MVVKLESLILRVEQRLRVLENKVLRYLGLRDTKLQENGILNQED